MANTREGTMPACPTRPTAEAECRSPCELATSSRGGEYHRGIASCTGLLIETIRGREVISATGVGLPEFTALLETTGGTLDKSCGEGPSVADGKPRLGSGHTRSMLGVRWRTKGLAVGGACEMVPVCTVAGSHRVAEHCEFCKGECAVGTWKPAATSLAALFDLSCEFTLNCLEERDGEASVFPMLMLRMGVLLFTGFCGRLTIEVGNAGIPVQGDGCTCACVEPPRYTTWVEPCGWAG